MKCLRCKATEEWIDHVPTQQTAAETKRLKAEVRRLRKALKLAESYRAGWRLAWGVCGIVDQYRAEHDADGSGFLRTMDGRCACNICTGIKRGWQEIQNQNALRRKGGKR